MKEVESKNIALYSSEDKVKYSIIKLVSGKYFMLMEYPETDDWDDNIYTKKEIKDIYGIDVKF